nr:hypothetical protein [Nonomuraea ceibae]
MPTLTLRQALLIVDAVNGMCPTEGVEAPLLRLRRQRKRLHDWALADVHFETEPGYQRWLLLRRSLTPNAKGKLELAHYLCHAQVGTTQEDLITVAGARWAIEKCFQSANNETGLDHYQVRRYDAWHRHITFAMLAHAYLAVTAAHTPTAHAAWASSHRRRSAVSRHTSDHHD